MTLQQRVRNWLGINTLLVQSSPALAPKTLVASVEPEDPRTPCAKFWSGWRRLRPNC